MLKSTLYKSLKDTKLKITPTCFGSYVTHHQGVQSCAWLELLVVIHRYFVVCLVDVWQRTLPNTDQTPKQILTSMFYIIECISRTIKVTDYNNARRKPEIKFFAAYILHSIILLFLKHNCLFVYFYTVVTSVTMIMLRD